MVFTNPDNPNNIRTIEGFDIVGFSGDVTADQIYVNFFSNDPDNTNQHILEGTLFVKDLNQFKALKDMLVRAVDDIEKKITK